MRQSKKCFPRVCGTRHRVLTLEVLEQRLVLATIQVTTAQDTINLSDGVTSLREAIFAANTVPGPDTIEFDPSLAGQTIRLTQGELSNIQTLSIEGLGADKLTIDASGSDPTPSVKNGDGSRIFDIDASQILPTPAFSVSISGLTLGLDFFGECNRRIGRRHIQPRSRPTKPLHDFRQYRLVRRRNLRPSVNAQKYNRCGKHNYLWPTRSGKLQFLLVASSGPR